MNLIKIVEVPIFILRLSIFVFAYILYLMQLVFIFIKLKSVSRKLFSYSSYFAALSLGISFNIKKEIKKNLNKKGIHISNHDNPLDIFIAQYIFQLPTITTVNKHLGNFLPFFKLSLRNFGHYSFNHMKLNERKSAYKYLNKICNRNQSILLFPSGSIYTSINDRFSKSVSNLSIRYNLEVIAWKFLYEDKSKLEVEYNENIIKYIIKRFSAKKIIITIQKVKVFNPDYYKHQDNLYFDLTNFYLT